MVETDLMTGRHLCMCCDLGVLLTSSTAPAVPHVNDSVQWASVLLVKASCTRGPTESAPLQN